MTIKSILILGLCIISIAPFAQNLTFENWQNESRQNKGLLPRYGDSKKSKEEIESDRAFEKKVMESFEHREDASNHMIDLGFQYLYRGDPRTAMYRFNQAYLLDRENPYIYWGYGAVYMFFERFDLAREQYEEGLKLDPQNEDILIDYGTTYLGEYYDYFQSDTIKANKLLDKAVEKLLTAYSADPNNPNSSYKLSICYLYKGQCQKANEYLTLSENLGNPNITDSFKNELEEKCRPSDLDCSDMKTGKFKVLDEGSGDITIERTEQFQIEESTKHGYKIKLKITWIDDCTYQLKPVEDMLNTENKNLPSMIVTCTITEITDNGYIQISSSDVDPARLKTEVIQVK